MTAGISRVHLPPERLSHWYFTLRAVAFVTCHKPPYYSLAVGNFVLVPVVVKVRKGQMTARWLSQPGSGDNGGFLGLGQTQWCCWEPRKLIHQRVPEPGIIPQVQRLRWRQRGVEDSPMVAVKSEQAALRCQDTAIKASQRLQRRRPGGIKSLLPSAAARS